MTLERIFAGWRNAYVSGVAQVEPVEGECVFCALFAADVSDRERLIVRRGDTCVVMLNLYPYGSGHLLVMPRRHIAALDQLDDAERSECFELLVDASKALQNAYEPDGMNVGANLGRAAGAGVPGHLHFHALPRWGGDTNFMTAIAETRVIPEDLATSYDKIKKAWPS
ncbi:MAG TPA: HIT domain-containing protein [Acidimicrobiales bacterium]|nr:HIT domain-containing protein [Acidimicrobiales bacterium]